MAASSLLIGGVNHACYSEGMIASREPFASILRQATRRVVATVDTRQHRDVLSMRTYTHSGRITSRQTEVVAGATHARKAIGRPPPSDYGSFPACSARTESNAGTRASVGGCRQKRPLGCLLQALARPKSRQTAIGQFKSKSGRTAERPWSSFTEVTVAISAHWRTAWGTAHVDP
jgi:hypothetical protein